MNLDPEISTVEVDPELVEKPTLYVESHGVKVPFRPTDFYHVLVQAPVPDIEPEVIPKPIEPPYVKHIRSGNWHAARTSIAKEIILEMIRANGFSARGIEAPLAVSAAVPKGCFVYESGRIVLNEAEALDYYWDSDGDRATALLSDDEECAVVVKFPVTKVPPILQRLKFIKPEVFEDFTATMWEDISADKPVTTYDLESLFYKVHTEVPVGLMTSNHNVKALYEAVMVKKLPIKDIPLFIHSDPQRALDIEDYGMKGVRKAGKSYVKAEILNYPRALSVRHAPFLTSVGSVTSKDEEQVDFIYSTDIPALINDINNFNVGFRPIRKPTKSSTDIERKRYYDGDLIARLVRLGILKYAELARNPDDPREVGRDLPPAVIVWVELPGYGPVALTDVKRESGLNAGLTFAFLLGPVYDAESGQIVAPLDHMAKIFMEFNNEIRNPNTNYLIGYYPRNVADLSKYEVKTALLQKKLIEYCGEYGDPAPCKWEPFEQNGVQYQAINPSPSSVYFTNKCIVVDYGRDMSAEEMLPIMREAQKLIPINAVGSKSTNRRIRKYPLANAVGGPCWAPLNANPRRAGQQRAQLIRTAGILNLRVAVVIGDTQTQTLITPSGVQKQLIEEMFLPEVSNSPDPDYLDPHDYWTLTGEKRRCWTKNPKDPIRVGKLIDLLGNKVMPRELTEQVYDENGDEIDLIFPLPELINKDAHHLWMKKGDFMAIEINQKLHKFDEPSQWYWDTQSVMAFVTDRIMMRTGAASENTKPRMRTGLYKNIDKEPIAAQLAKIKKLPDTKPNLEFAMQLQSSANQLWKALSS